MEFTSFPYPLPFPSLYRLLPLFPLSPSSSPSAPKRTSRYSVQRRKHTAPRVGGIPRIHDRHPAAAHAPQSPHVRPVERAHFVPARSAGGVLREAGPRALHVARQGVLLRGDEEEGEGVEDEGDLGGVVDAGVGEGLQVREGGVEEVAPDGHLDGGRGGRVEGDGLRVVLALVERRDVGRRGERSYAGEAQVGVDFGDDVVVRLARLERIGLADRGLQLWGCAEGGLQEGGEVVLAEGKHAAFLRVAADQDRHFGDLAGGTGRGGVVDGRDVVADGPEVQDLVLLDALDRGGVGGAGTAEDFGIGARAVEVLHEGLPRAGAAGRGRQAGVRAVAALAALKDCSAEEAGGRGSGD